MSQKYKERGGGSASGLADSMIAMLRGTLGGGMGGGSGMAQTGDAMNNMGGIGGVLSDILSGGAGRIGGAYSDMINTDTTRQVDALRSRFGASGGMSMGTPAAYGEALLRSEQAPKLVQAIGGLQMGAINPLMQIMAGLASKGIAQREGTMTPNPWMSGIAALAPAAGAILGGPMGASIGSGLSGIFNGGNLQIPNVINPGVDINTPMPAFNLSQFGF